MELADKDERAVKNRKVIMWEVNFKLNVNGIMEDIANCGNVSTAVVEQTPDMRPEEFSDGELIVLSKEHGFGEKDEDIPKEVTQAQKFILQKLLEMSHIESAKVKTLETYLKLERNVTVHQSIEKIFTLCCKLYDEKKIKYCANSS